MNIRDTYNILKLNYQRIGFSGLRIKLFEGSQPQPLETKPQPLEIKKKKEY